MQISNRIRELRARDDLTQEALAKKINVTRQTIIAIEKGEYLPSLELGYKIADAFHLPIDQVFITKEVRNDV